MLDAVQTILNEKNKKYIRIDGNTSSEVRKLNVDKFQFDDSCVCALLSITAANAGITLTKAELILFAELHWNPSILNQAESRAHRIGQEKQVTVRYLLAPGTADDFIWPLLQEKQKILGEIGLTRESYENVPIIKQDFAKNEKIADGLRSSQTDYGTMDISNYFMLQNKKEEEEIDGVKNESGEKNGKAISFEHMDIFNDGYDDVLSSIDI